MSGAAKTAAATDLDTNDMMAIPVSLRFGATAFRFAPEWLIFGQPRLENRGILRAGGAQ
jgi:hypothetical protein